MNKILSSAAFAAVLLCAVPASAQVAAAPAGARVEALAGYDRVKIAGQHENGLFGGVGAGYDVALGNIALGADVEATLANTDYDLGAGTVLRAGRDLYAGGRLSFGLSDNLVGYLKAGYTNARVKLTGFGGDNLNGARVGTGLQYLLGGNAYVGGEYRYSNYEADVVRHQLALTLGTRFGAAPVAAPAPIMEAPAPAPAPATQTCADGSVILASDLCPAPAPAPVPAPAQAGERG